MKEIQELKDINGGCCADSSILPNHIESILERVKVICADIEGV